MLLIADDELSENDGRPGVQGGVADVVLASRQVRSVDHQLVGVRVESGGGANGHHIGSVTGLGHGEASECPQRTGIGQVLLMMVPGAQLSDRPTVQTPLHTGLDHERQIYRADHLDRSHRTARIRVLQIEQTDLQTALGEPLQHAHGVLTLLGRRHELHRAQIHLPDRVPDQVLSCCEPAVQQLGQPLHLRIAEGSRGQPRAGHIVRGPVFQVLAGTTGVMRPLDDIAARRMRFAVGDRCPAGFRRCGDARHISS